MNRIAYFCYHRKDDNILETAIKSLRSVCDCAIVIATDDAPEALRALLTAAYGVQWDIVLPEQMENRRATCKIERLQSLVDNTPDGAEVMIADVDTYYLKDPFTPFAEHPEMELGVTTRGYDHWAPINGGIFYLRVGPRAREWLRWMAAEILTPRWKPFASVRRQYGHEVDGLDWHVDQDFLIATWQQRDSLNLSVVDVGPQYNYCPTVEVSNAAEQIRTAYRNKSVAVLHLKSRLKELVYSGLLEHAVTHHGRGPNEWL